MPCTPVALPGGGRAIVCSRSPKCATPGCYGRREALCDWPAPGKKSGTCDKGMCARHRNPVGPNTDYCAEHLAAHQQAIGL